MHAHNVCLEAPNTAAVALSLLCMHIIVSLLVDGSKPSETIALLLPRRRLWRAKSRQTSEQLLLAS